MTFFVGFFGLSSEALCHFQGQKMFWASYRKFW